MTWCVRSRGCGVEARLGPTCRIVVSTSLAMIAVVTMDMHSETTVHIAEDAAVAVGAGYSWAVDVSFRRFDRPPTPRRSGW